MVNLSHLEAKERHTNVVSNVVNLLHLEAKERHTDVVFENTFLARLISRYDAFGDGLIVFLKPRLFERIAEEQNTMLDSLWSFALLPSSLRMVDKPEQIGVSFLRVLHGQDYQTVYHGSRSPGFLASIYLTEAKVGFFKAGMLLGSLLSSTCFCVIFLIGRRIRWSLILILIGSVVPVRDSFADMLIDLIRISVLVCLVILVFRLFCILNVAKRIRD